MAQRAAAAFAANGSRLDLDPIRVRHGKILPRPLTNPCTG
jgi:hypothetical protein